MAEVSGCAYKIIRPNVDHRGGGGIPMKYDNNSYRSISGYKYINLGDRLMVEAVVAMPTTGALRCCHKYRESITPMYCVCHELCIISTKKVK